MGCLVVEKSMAVDQQTRAKVERRAEGRCEYCQAPSWLTGIRFHIEHIKPQRLGGSDSLTNLALACPSCNIHKLVKTKGVDPDSGKVVRLYHPRRDSWQEHFTWSRDCKNIKGKSAIGRATVVALCMNDKPPRAEVRALWKASGYLPYP